MICFSRQNEQDDLVFLIRLKDEELVEAFDHSTFLQMPQGCAKAADSCGLTQTPDGTESGEYFQTFKSISRDTSHPFNSVGSRTKMLISSGMSLVTVKAPFIRQWFCLIFKDPDLRLRLRRRKGKKQRRD